VRKKNWVHSQPSHNLMLMWCATFVGVNLCKYVMLHKILCRKLNRNFWTLEYFFGQQLLNAIVHSKLSHPMWSTHKPLCNRHPMWSTHQCRTVKSSPQPCITLIIFSRLNTRIMDWRLGDFFFKEQRHYWYRNTANLLTEVLDPYRGQLLSNYKCVS
jgi:hypothetical protein